MIRELHIRSYFSISTDLAAEMRDWPEFVDGDGYFVVLRDSATNEAVSVKLKDENEDVYLRVHSPQAGPLFDRVTGRTIYALSLHSDNLQVRHAHVT